jgi:DNA-binding IclR family transcriptional regulator
VSQEQQFADAGLRARQPKAVQSAFAVLEEVARCGPGVTGMEVSRNLGLPKATTYRLLNLLVEDEYLVRMPDLSGFALGRKVEMLARLADGGRTSQRR